MIEDSLRPLAEKLYSNQDYRFWLCQLTGWSGYSLVTFLSITLVDDMVSWPHISHIVMSAILGMLTSWPLRSLFQRTFDLTLTRRLVIASLAVIFFSFVWTILRVLVFAWLVGETAIWGEFNYWYFGSMFVFLSWTVLYYAIKYYELLTLEHQKLLEESALRNEEKYRRQAAESLARDAQLQMLRYQLNPHFLFNTLNAINALVRLKENNKAQDMIQGLSKFLRHSLGQTGGQNVTLDKELESLELYLNIEKTRFEDRLTLVFDIDPRAQKALVPSLILQPIIENSMKYAIAASEEGGTVCVRAQVLEDQLQLEVSDTGPGINTATADEGRGIGLRNTLDRLETLYGSDYTFESDILKRAGLTVIIRIPLTKEIIDNDQLGVAL